MRRYKDNSGLAHVADKGDVTVRSLALDDMDIEPIDFLKMDCEGYEYFALKGAERTIRRDKPCILVEEGLPHLYDFRGNVTATELLRSWGAEVRFSMGPDHCMSWPE
jgi:hypothetical protein